MSSTKRCITCGKYKEFSAFTKNARTSDGFRNECTKCRNHKRRIIRSADYDALYREQKGRCAICGISSEDYGRKFSVDHDHENGEVRALLCHHCNTIIGMADEDLEILKSAIGYLKHHQTKII